jgi:hypothetical protein
MKKADHLGTYFNGYPFGSSARRVDLVGVWVEQDYSSDGKVTGLRTETFWPFQTGDRVSFSGRNLTILSISPLGIAVCRSRKMKHAALEEHPVALLRKPLKRVGEPEL